MIYFLNLFLLFFSFIIFDLGIADSRVKFDIFFNELSGFNKFIIYFFINDDLIRLKSFAAESNSFGVLLLPCFSYLLFNLKTKNLEIIFF